MEFWDILDRDRNFTGRTHQRGKPLQAGDYHLVVHVWIRNGKGEYLISKRTPNKPFPLMWEPTGGSAVSGDDSLKTALKEVQEELGISLDPEKGRLLTTLRRDTLPHQQFTDVWLFTHETDILSVVLQEGETCDAMWALPNKIRELISAGQFVHAELFPYLEDLLTSNQ